MSMNVCSDRRSRTNCLRCVTAFAYLISPVTASAVVLPSPAFLRPLDLADYQLACISLRISSGPPSLSGQHIRQPFNSRWTQMSLARRHWPTIVEVCLVGSHPGRGGGLRSRGRAGDRRIGGRDPRRTAHGNHGGDFEGLDMA